MIKAVLFDMDGILFDTEIVMKEGWLKAARELNFTLTEEHLSRYLSTASPFSSREPTATRWIRTVVTSFGPFSSFFPKAFPLREPQ